MKPIGWWLGACALLLTPAVIPSPVQAQPTPDSAALYRGSAIVTGTDMRARPDGMGQCLLQVLAKVAGDPSLANNPQAAPLAAEAAEYAEDFVYFDRMSDIPHHDEQGSSDRPYDLVVNFDPSKIDAALISLGSTPWRGPRPALAVSLAVTDRSGAAYPLTADGDASERLREALFAAGERFGLRVVLLPGDSLPKTADDVADLLQHAAILVPSASLAGLTGTLAWSDKDNGWVGAWRLAFDGREASWQIRGVSFDDAMRDMVGGSVAELSGHSTE